MTIKFDGTLYRVAGYNGIAFVAMRPATEEIELTEVRIDSTTGLEYDWPIGDYDVVDSDELVIVRMVGDDTAITVDINDLTELDPDDVCNSCGQIGCEW